MELFARAKSVKDDLALGEAIAKTKAIDLWILFPLGISVNRMLMKKREEIPKEWSDDLDKIFGTHDWKGKNYE